MLRPNWRSAALCLILMGTVTLVASPDEAPAPKAASEKLELKPNKPKDLSESVTRGLEYLIAQQHENGGFGQGGGWRTDSQGRNGRVEGSSVKDPPDVGNTCIAALTLIRAGNTPQQGNYSKQLAKAVDFIQTHVEEADQESLYVTPVRDTQLQSKIGRYVDTFLTALVLSELKGQMTDKASEERLLAALNKTIGKIEANQQADGTFAGNAGWASVLSQGICSKALNRAYQKGGKVKTETLQKDLTQSVTQLDSSKTTSSGTSPALSSGAVAVGGLRLAGEDAEFISRLKSSPSSKGDAGVSLYFLSANAGRVQDAVNSNSRRSADAKAILNSPTADKKAKDDAKEELKKVTDSEQANETALQEIASNIGSDRFLRGFGNNGGEEFLSYMNISETLFARGGEAWEKWDRQVCQIITKAQNNDGSWSGHHCITGRTFCTSAALLTMMADRAPLPVAEVKPAVK